MDNTSYRNDLEESLLAYMEMNGALSRDKLPPELRLIPFKDTKDFKEGLVSYYYRLCETDDLICYPWVAQVFSGFTLRELKGHVDGLMEYGKPLKAKYYSGETVKETSISPPKPFAGMQELYAKLMENGINVYVMTAASEELVRMVASDPKYGYNVKPENVIINDNGTVKVADFGLARAVSSQTVTSTAGMLLGTVAYLSPEQVERGAVDVLDGHGFYGKAAAMV